MILQRCLLLGGLALAFLSNACQSTNPQNPEKPEIASGMDLTEAYVRGRTWGGEIMQKVKDLARSRGELPKLQKLTEDDLIQNNAGYPLPVLTTIVNTYYYAGQKVNPEPVQAMLNSPSEAARRLGWRMAAMKPSPAIKDLLEKQLNQALNQGTEDSLIFPEMALALKENEMKAEYSFLVRGLETHGSAEFANAMLALDPKQATGPFLDYLMRADLEDLRQLNQKSVNIYTCTVIFRFLAENPLPMGHPGVPSIFLFAVSRNRGLADMANAVLEKHIPENRTTFATLLSRLPVPVQIAFIENSQRVMTANMRLLLTDLKEVEQHKEVIEELNAPQAAGAQ